MTPETFNQNKLEFMDEYEEKLRCLAVLDQELKDVGGRLETFGRRLRRGESVGGLGDTIRDLDRVPTLIKDYREVLGRCTSLHQALRFIGL